ncbi:MAG: hypothetical protein U5J99_07485 [Parvularculaceae bacterium]|nr:hypothetical protein [Parvularculaceae bacterium]
MAKSAAKQWRRPDERHGRELTGGYIASGLIFAGVTALWAFVVREDPYYRLTDLFGARVPAMMIAYLALMPLMGFIIGRWRYDQGRGGFTSFAAKLGARALHFTYAHSLIVLFTAAMLAEAWLGLNLDDQVKRFDDRTFDLAARFAPWLAAYLAGYNFGRASVAGSALAPAPLRAPAALAFIDAPSTEEYKEADPEFPLRTGAGKRARAEPAFVEGNDSPETRTPRPAQTASGLSIGFDPEDRQPGFLPPQDVDRLRPAFNRLR